ncbi:hypothetical protein MTR67_030799 [Solanum verrucosum]|uniref:Retrotransposon gag domain-containing protein n=1 Tax=Solanum verrucosum TaxID=315347 RepID=A0AAF0ZGL1_SOLVR|nr:hypothetical protein MTR67_030799 [Solanum verrucosum]
MNPPSFMGLSTTEDPKNFIKELKKVFEVMHVADTERVELAAYQQKNVARTWFDQWKEGRGEDAPPASWGCFEEAFLGNFFPRELKEAKVREFLTLKQDSLSVHEYRLKFAQISRYVAEMGADMRSRMNLFVAGLARLSSKEGRAAMLIGNMDISRELESIVNDWVYLKVSPMKGVMRFGKKGKLSPRYIDPYIISKRVGNVAYELELPQELAAVHPVFHISMLKKCMGDPSLIIPTKDIGIKDSLYIEEIPIQILDCQVRKLKTKEVASIKVLWRNQFVEEATWEV